MVHYTDQPPSNHSISNQDLNHYGHFLDQLHTQINQLENQVTEVEQFYQSTDVQNTDRKTKGWKKPPTGSKKPLQYASEEIMRHVTKILSEITHHEHAWPFLEPVDVKGLKLYDYFEIILKPMDFSTIKRKMNAKDGSGYTNVREICADVRLVFNNAMKYNGEGHDVYDMAKILLEEFEKKWLHLLPKVAKLESELAKEAHENLNKKLAQEATYGNMSMKLSEELSKADKALTNLKSMMIAKCRKLSSLEKQLLAADISKLSPDNLRKSLEIVNENDPNFQVDTEDVTLDLDSLSNYTLWRLYMFVKNALELQNASSGITHVHNIEENEVIPRADDIEEEKKPEVKRRRMM